MAEIKIEAFSGTVPRVEPRLLKNGQAQLAENCRLLSGALSSWYQRLTTHTLTKSGEMTSLYRFGETGAQYWLHWAEDVDVQRAPVANDTTERTYFTGTDAPRATDNTLVALSGTDYPTDSYLLGVPAPTAAPTTTLGAGGTGSPSARTYVYTMVTGWGEEGPPSDASTVLPTVLPGQSVVINGFAAVPAGDYNITHRRIYRSNGGTAAASFQLVAEITVGTTSYDDTILDADLGATLASELWDPPPAGMKGIRALANNTLVGFVDNQVCFCVPGYYHAWPVSFRKTYERPVVGIGSFSNTVVVFLTAGIHVITCNSPDTASTSPLPFKQACVSKRSIVHTENGVAYASPDGFVHITPAGTEVLTEGVFTREEWQALYPSTMHTRYHDGRFFVFYRTGFSLSGLTEGEGFIFDPDTRSVTTLPFYAHGGYLDDTTDSMSLIVYNTTTGDCNVDVWEGGDERETARWQSGDVPTPRPTNMGVAMVVWADLSAEELAAAEAAYALALAEWNAAYESDGYDAGTLASDLVADLVPADGYEVYTTPPAPPAASVTFYLYGDGTLRATKTVATSHPFVLPGGYNATVWSVRVDGNRDIKAIHVATTMRELSAL